MSIILHILSILGIILLSMLILLLLILALLLFWPFRYRIDALTHSKEEESRVIRVEARLSWLLRLLDVHLVYADGLVVTGRVAWYRFFEMNTEEDKEDLDASSDLSEVSDLDASSDLSESTGLDTSPDLAEFSDFGDVPVLHESSEHRVEENKQNGGYHPKIEEDADLKTKIDTKIKTDVFHIVDKLEQIWGYWEDGWERILSYIEDTGEHIENAMEKKEQFQDKLKWYREQFEDERHRHAIYVILNYTWKLLKHLAPRKAYGSLLIGLSDPASTGQAIGMLTMFCASFCPKIRIASDFERAVVEADMHIKGRMYLAPVLWYLLVVILNKDVKYLNKTRKEWKDGR